MLQKQLQMKREKKGIGDRLEAFLKRKEEEDEATCLMERVRKNVEDGRRSFPCSRMDLPQGDDSVTACLYACLH